MHHQLNNPLNNLLHNYNSSSNQSSLHPPTPILTTIIKLLLIISLTFLNPIIIASSYATDISTNTPNNPPLPTNLPLQIDGTTNTSIDSAANGVPIVNIAPPNNFGLSHNKFNSYNVGPSGLVINNATGNPNQAVQTSIAGLITDNTNLTNSGSARVILNEVTSTNRSILNGYTEIGGRQADLIIANPNGIEMNSSGFINVGKLTAIIGSANQFNGDPSNLSFNLNGNKNSGNNFLPKLTISGLGLDVTRVTETDLVADIMEIVAPIYGGDNIVNLRAGDKEFNYNIKEVTSNNNNPESTQPDEVAIDASNIAKIQAGQIYMIATKEGFGVKYTGDMLSSRGGVTIDAKGNIIYNNIASQSGNINIKTINGNVTTTGITHNKDINSNITIKASKNLNNQAQLISAKDVNVTADIINNSKEIIAGNEISITANQITNNDTIIAGNKINITAQDHLINNNAKLESNGFINIAANNINNQGILKAVDYINITANDSVINGIKDADNSNIVMATNNYLTIQANNNIDNHAILSAKTILSLNSLKGDINNHHKAELISSDISNKATSQLILQAINGSINQYSKNSVIVNGNHIITANDYNNTGRIDIAGNLTMNIANNLINDIGALIYAGNDMYLNVANDLTNKEDATIYAKNDLFITNRALNIAEQTTLNTLKSEIAATSDNNIIKQKRLEIANIFDNLKINKLENISGNIESYGGDIYIAANIFNNIRSEYRYVEHKDLPGFQRADSPDLSSLRRNIIGNIVDESVINGNNIIINSDSFYNKASSIYAQNDITIKANSFTNQTLDLYAATNKYINSSRSGCPYTSYPVSLCYGRGGWKYVQAMVPNGYLERYMANIKARNNLLGTVTSYINNDTIIKDYSNVISASDKNAQIVNGIDINNLLNSGKVEKDLSNYINGPNNQGMFKKSQNPNSPLFETRSQFIDQSKFFGSDYFYQKIGLNLTDVQTEFEQQNKRLIGDEFFQTKIIEQQLKTIRKNALLLSDNSANINTEIQSLLDNAANEYERLGLSANETLTQSQIDSLQKDIIWYETQTIDQQIYIVPKIYLTKATRDNLKNNNNLTTKSTLMAMGDLQLDSNSLINSGSIIANNIDITTANNITNNNISEIIANNDLNLTSNNGSIINFSKLKAIAAISLSAQNIINTSTVKTNAANLLNLDNPAYINNQASSSNNISSTLFETATITSASLNANAEIDFNNYAANITTTSGDLNIIAGDDINITSLALRNRDEFRSKKYTKITDITTNTSSNITSASGITLVTNGYAIDNELGTSDLEVGSSIIVTGSNISAINDLNLIANNNSIITNAVNKDYSFEQRTKKGSIKTSRTSRTDYVETAVNSKLTANNINITTNNNIYIQGSNLNNNIDNINSNIAGNTNLNAANDTIITNTILKEYHHATKEVSNRGVFKGLTALTSAIIDIATIPINLSIAASSPILKNTNNPLQKTLNKVAPDFIADNLDYKKLRSSYKNLAYNNQYHNTNIQYYTKNDLANIVSSNLISQNNINITSTNNTIIQASNLKSGVADINPNIIGSTAINTNNLNILAAKNYNYNNSNKITKKTMTIRNDNKISTNINYINSNLIAKNNQFTFNITNQADIRAKDLTITKQNYITDLKSQIASNNITQTNLIANNKEWQKTTRQLTEVGAATIAITAVAATMITGGASLGLVKTAIASSAATTASITAANTSMNANGDFFKQVKTISKDIWDNTTSKESFENYTISAATALLASGLMDISGLNEIRNTAQLSVNNTNTATTITTSNPSIYMQAGKTLAESSISTLSSTAAKTIVKNRSISDTIKEQGINILTGAVANIGAKQIGVNYKNSTQIRVDKAIQLTSHAALGTGVSYLSGNDVLSGVVSGVVGELAGEYIRDSGINKKTGSQLAGLAGGYSAIFIGNAVGLDDSEVTDSIFAGQRLGINAALYNAYFAKRPLESKHKRTSKILSKLELNILDKNNLEVAHEQLFFEDKEGGNIGYFSDNSVRPDRDDLLHYYVKSKEGFDDDLMRKAVDKLNNMTHPYDILGFDTCTGKYNCQDWANDVRREYYRLKTENNIQLWNNLINNR